MPAEVQEADNNDETSPRLPKSNAWPTEERDDIFNRRQKGEKWDTICVDYPYRSKHAMQQQYSIMKKQAALVTHLSLLSTFYFLMLNQKQKTPTKGRGRRKGKASALTSPAVMTGPKKALKRRPSPKDADPSDNNSDEESTGYVATKAVGRYDGPPESDNDSESVKEPDSARKQRLRRRLNKTSVEDDEEPVSARPKRTRTSVVNYNVLQNSGYDQDDQGEEANPELTSDVPARKSKIVALKMGIPKTPVVEGRDLKARKVRKQLNINTDEEALRTPTIQDDASTRRMSTRGKRVVNGTIARRDSPASFAAAETTNVLDSKRKRRSLFPPGWGELPQNSEPEPDLDVASDSKATRSSRKRKNSEAEVNETRPKKIIAVESAPENQGKRSAKKKRRGKPREHLGYLPNGQPRQRRRRRTRAEMEEAERKTPTTVTRKRRSAYQFPHLGGYNGPPPPDIATILARQKEHERQNPESESESESEAESTSSSLLPLDDEDDTTNKQPPVAGAKPSVAMEEEISPLTRPTVEGQLSAESIEQQQPINKAVLSMSSKTLDIPDILFFPEDIERAREHARKVRAIYEEQKMANVEQLTASEKALAEERLRNEELTQKFDDLHKSHSGCESKAKDAKAVARQLEGLREIRSLYDEGLQKLDLTETALTEEKRRNAELEEEFSVSRTESLLREKNLEGQIAELTRQRSLENQASSSDENTKLTTAAREESERAKELHRELKNAEAKTTDLDRVLHDHVIRMERLEKCRKELETENASLKSRLNDTRTLSVDGGTPSKYIEDPSQQLANTLNDTFTIRVGADSTSTPTPAIPSPYDGPATLSTNGPITHAKVKGHLEHIRKTHVKFAYHLRASSEDHEKHNSALKTLHEKLEEGDISMNGVRQSVKTMVEGSEKVGKGLKSATEYSEVAKGKVMGLWDEIEPPPPQ
ncbi:MAG: hypothetical protein Q9213_006549 [Squamulea squamosa]